MNSPRKDIPAQAVQKLADSKSLAVITGAGVSAESGVPTFRGKDGLWKNYQPHQLATPMAFHDDPGLVWEWYHWRRQTVLACSPNPAHNAIARMEERVGDFTLITQNVDRLHARAGSERVLELHGDLHRARCSECSAITGLEGHPSLSIAPIEETHQHGIRAILQESLAHEQRALALYKRFLKIEEHRIKS